MFKNIYYDRFRNKIHLWEVINGKVVKYEDDYEKIYYMEDKSKKSNIKDIYGKPVVKKISKTREEVRNLKEAGVYCCETDVSSEVKFLQERYKNLQLKPNMEDFNISYLDIENEGSIDSETTPEAINLITVKSSKTNQVYTFGTSEFTKKNSKYVQNYKWVPDELEMLSSFVRWFRKQKFDIITGWNVLKFDMKYIINRIKKLTDSGLESKLSPLNRLYFDKREQVYYIPGISILDYQLLYKNFTFDTLPSYSLNAVSMHELKEGKLELEGQINTTYESDWNSFVEYNVQDVLLPEKLEKQLRFLALTVTLCYEALVPFEKIYSSIATLEGYILRHLHENNLVMPDKKRHHVDWWRDGNHFNVNGYLQNVRWEDNEKTFEPFFVKGGHCEANPDFYKHNMSYDVESEYPHMIMMYNISPETKVTLPTKEQIESMDLIKSPVNGVYYKREKGVIPIITKKIFDERRSFKKLMFKAEKDKNKTLEKYYDSQQHIRKIMINSLYGILANQGCHFFDVDNARVVTRGGRKLIRYMGKTTNNYFQDNWHKVAHKYFPGVEISPLKKKLVCVVDTDSNYLNLDEIKQNVAPNMDYLEFAYKMEREVFDPFFDKILNIYAKKSGVEQLINFKREGIITKQFVLKKKKYITELLADEDKVFEIPVIKYKGVEVVRSDTPMFCRQNIKNVIEEIFESLDKDKTLSLIRKINKQFKTSKIEDISSNSGVKEYTKYAKPTSYYIKKHLFFEKATPIHNRAAICYNYMLAKYNLRYMEVDNGTKIKYIYTNEKNIIRSNVIGFVGNYPKEFNTHFKIDYEVQFEKTFLGVIQRMFDILKWGKISLKVNKLSGFFE